MTRSKLTPGKAPKRLGKQRAQRRRLSPVERLEAIRHIYVLFGSVGVVRGEAFAVFPVDYARRIYELAAGAT